MRQASSLEEEKRRLLEQLENSRVVYRRMLTDGEDSVHEEAPYTAQAYASPIRQEEFPRSQTMRWIIQHPYLLAFGAVALAVAGKKGLSRKRRKTASAPAAETEGQNAEIRKGLAATTLGTSVATAATMILRNPAQMRAAMRAIALAVNYYKSRRRNPRQRFE